MRTNMEPQKLMVYRCFDPCPRVFFQLPEVSFRHFYDQVWDPSFTKQDFMGHFESAQLHPTHGGFVLIKEFLMF